MMIWKLKRVSDANKRIWSLFGKRILLILAVLAITWYVSLHWFGLMLIWGESMKPTFHNMQLVILDRREREYTYGDVIAFRCEGLSAVLVKRIAACPGDTVIIDNGTLYVNGEVGPIYPGQGMFAYAGILAEPVCPGEGEYIVIGDNMKESKDSRYEQVGMVDRKEILGVVKE